MTLVSNGFGNPTIQHRIFKKIRSFPLQIWCCIDYSILRRVLRPTSSSKWTRIFQPQNWLVCTFRSSFLLLFFPSPLRSFFTIGVSSELLRSWSCHRLQVCHTSWEEPELLSLLSFPPLKRFPFPSHSLFLVSRNAKPLKQQKAKNEMYQLMIHRAFTFLYSNNNGQI